MRLAADAQPDARPIRRVLSGRLASRGQALFPDLPDTPRGKGPWGSPFVGVVLRCGHMTDYIAVDSLR